MGEIAKLELNGRAIPWLTVLLAITQFDCVILAPLQQVQDIKNIVENKVALSKTPEGTATITSGISTHTSTSATTVNDIDLKIKNSFKYPGNSIDQNEKNSEGQIRSQTANVATRNEMPNHGSTTPPTFSVKRRSNFHMLGSDTWNIFTSSERRERRLIEDFTERKNNHETSLPDSDEFHRENFSGLEYPNPTLPPRNSDVPEFKAIDLNLLNELMAKNHLFSPQNSKRPKTITDSEKDIKGLSNTDRTFQGNFNTKDNMILQNSDENAQRSQFIKSGKQNVDTVSENMENKGRWRQLSAGAISSEVLDQMKDQSDSERRQTEDKSRHFQIKLVSNNENDLLRQIPSQKELPVITSQSDPNIQDELNENLQIDVRDIMKSIKNQKDVDNFLATFKDFHDAPHNNKNRYLQFVKMKLQTFLNALGLSTDMNVNGTMSTPSQPINPENKEQLADKPYNALGSGFQQNLDASEPVDLNKVEANRLPSPAFRRPTQKIPDSPRNFFLQPVAVKKANSSKETNERVNQITIGSNSKRGRSVCNYQRLNLKMLLEYFHTGKMCGSHIVRMRFGIGK